ncbi:hypothetical protein STCU_11021 [Strigomonas culicis]|uniref:Uncharacterized protein n=1 Tax=Strigomonas culicis TaxID=28005 RepID=S9TIN0_9TRYP|nr:hypothetical protein STCU_11021 [Strigomonas culicis]|eukprot:EPY16749.1 hypothetical protein STCU_11021 [Strigomonas culicis]
MKKIEVLVATSALISVNITDDSTFFYLFVHQFDWDEQRVPRAKGMPTRRAISSYLRHIWYQPGTYAQLQPLVEEVRVNVEFDLMLVPSERKGGYSFVDAEAHDVAVIVAVHPNKKEFTGAPKTLSGSEEGVPLDIILSSSRIGSVLEMVALNLMCNNLATSGPSAECAVTDVACAPNRGLPQPRKKSDDDSNDGADKAKPSPSVSFLFTLPSTNLTVVSSETKRRFQLSVEKGLQYYRATGGRWAASGAQSLEVALIHLFENVDPAAGSKPGASTDAGAGDAGGSAKRVSLFSMDRVSLSLSTPSAANRRRMHTSDESGAAPSYTEATVILDKPLLHVLELDAWDSLRRIFFTRQLTELLNPKPVEYFHSRSSSNQYFSVSRTDTMVDVEYEHAAYIVTRWSLRLLNCELVARGGRVTTAHAARHVREPHLRRHQRGSSRYSCRCLQPVDGLEARR